MKNYRCNDCEKEWCCETEKQLIAHYRMQHPENPWGLWTAIGNTGDVFANTLARQILARYRQEEPRDVQQKAQAYDKLISSYNELSRRLQMVHLAIGGAPYRET